MIYLSTDGVYNKLNISSLYDPENELYVLEELIVHNVTNTSDITLATSDIDLDNNFILDLIGNPKFTATESDDFDISDLPGTGIEVATIDSLAKTSNIESIILTGNGASEANIKNLESPNILHIATHGFFLTDNTVSEDMYSIESNPLMRSGLLLSGSQHSFRGDHINFDGSLDAEDGILTAYEAMNLDLSHSDLVVLSACETGLGEVKNGEGVYGLQRSFAIAGAKSVLISLWKVDDNSTKELMILFYKNILSGIDKFEALNMAQKELKSKYDLPYYWGAFVLSGI
jgi:CHAT domain-containing protein